MQTPQEPFARQPVPDVIETNNGEGNAAAETEDDSSEDSVEFGLTSTCKDWDSVEVVWGDDEDEGGELREL